MAKNGKRWAIRFDVDAVIFLQRNNNISYVHKKKVDAGHNVRNLHIVHGKCARFARDFWQQRRIIRSGS